jgi:hypothetical protein
MIFFFFFFADPREWDRDDVRRWLRHVCHRHSLPQAAEDREGD